MAVKLRLTNDQLKKLRRWTKTRNVFLAAKRQAHTFAEHQMGDAEIGSEMVQVTTPSDDHSAECLRPSAFAWVKNPMALVYQHLDMLRKPNLLTWHPQKATTLSRPKSELWLKIGGDKEAEVSR